MNTAGTVFEIKRFAVHDGPGIRTTVFFKGCPLKCRWCHNPEGIAREPELAFLERKCAQCGECFIACPLTLHGTDKNGIHTIKRENCKLCCACVKACLPGALKIYGTEYTAKDLFEIVCADADFYRQSGGGITCSGGEPLTQADFLVDFLSLCKGSNFHTAIDTSGHAGWTAFEKVLKFTDVFLYDIKHMDAEKHKQLTGVDNRLILENLQRLSECGAAVEIRMPIIPGLNDDEENILRAANFLKGVKTITLIRLLPYHALSGSKYASIGKTHNMPAPAENMRAVLNRVFGIFESAGLPAAPLH